MTRVQRRSKSQLHNRMKRLGYKWLKRCWWKVFNFKPLPITMQVFQGEFIIVDEEE
jgi:hypothetical protein